MDKLCNKPLNVCNYMTLYSCMFCVFRIRLLMKEILKWSMRNWKLYPVAQQLPPGHMKPCHFLQLLLCSRINALSARLRIPELRDAHDWFLLLWLTRNRDAAPSFPLRKHHQFYSLGAPATKSIKPQIDSELLIGWAIVRDQIHTL